MKKIVIIFAFSLLAVGCDKTVYSQPDSSLSTQNPTSTLQVITNPTDLIVVASTTPIATSTVKPKTVTKVIGQQKVQSPAVIENPVVVPLPQPTQTQQPAIVCNNISGGSLPAGWFSDGQGNCSPTSPQQQAAAVATQQQAQQQAALQAQAAAQQQEALQEQQQKAAILSQCNSVIKGYEQQILNLKNSYYQQLPGIMSVGDLESAQGRANALLNQTNQQISQIDIEIQQEQLNCQG